MFFLFSLYFFVVFTLLHNIFFYFLKGGVAIPWIRQLLTTLNVSELIKKPTRLKDGVEFLPSRSKTN